jgi:carboxypeptidase T
MNFIPMRINRYLVLFVLLTLWAVPTLAESHHAMVRFWIDSPTDQAYIDANHNAMDIADGRRGEHYDIVVPIPELATFTGRGYRTEVLHQDLETFYADRLGNRGNYGLYHTYSEAVAWMDSLHDQFPQIISEKWSIGQGHLGNEIWCFRVSDNPEVDEQGEPEVLFDGLHHAREIMASEMSLMLAAYLGEAYDSGDPEIVQLVDANEIYMVPIVNPDGMLYNEQISPYGGGMWRKNRRNNGGTYGVDPNRNYPYEWGCDYGSSGDPGSDTYRGPSPGSEPEVQAMMTLINEHDFITRQSWHTYGNLTLYPWGYTTANSPDETIFREMAAAMTQYNGYTPGQPGDVLYDVCGGNFDWDYGAQTEHTKIYAFTNEIGSSSDGFWPADNRRQTLFEENLWPSLYMIQMSASLRGVSWQHDPLPFTADAVNDYLVTGVANGYDDAAIITSSVVLRYRVNGGSFLEVSMSDIGSGSFAAYLPNQVDGTLVEYYLYAEDVDGNSGSTPPTAPASLHYFEVGTGFEHDMEEAQAWNSGAADDDAGTGLWVRVNPVGTDAQPGSDHSPAGMMCWVTGQGTVGGSIGENDVDSGKTSLLSPVFDMTGAQELDFSYWMWFSNDQGSAPGTDYWDVYLSNDAGQNWTEIEHTLENTAGWESRSFDLFTYFATAGQVQLKFTASDEGDGSIVEAAVDDFVIAGVFSTTDLEEMPEAFRVNLEQNFPNPFNPKTTIRFQLSGETDVNLGIYDARGRLIRQLISNRMIAGTHAVTWSGLDAMGKPVASGAYFAKMRCSDGTEHSKRMMLIK